MEILVLGGTNFIGPHVVQAVLDQGHKVAVFNRGKSEDCLPDAVERLVGDRLGNVAALSGRAFDATIDLSAYAPRAVTAVLDTLGDPGHYCFISTLSVYASFGPVGQDESAALIVLDEDSEDATPQRYGGLKVQCEAAVLERCPNATVLRLGIVVGAFDPSDRFTYWVARCLDGDTIIAPGPPSAPMQWIDVRDVAGFACHCVEQHVGGTFNVVTPPGEHTIGALLAAARAGGQQLWVDRTTRAEHELSDWRDFPAWLAPDGDTPGFATFRCDAAVAAGLTHTPLRETVDYTAQWWRNQDGRALKTGLARERESELMRDALRDRPIVRLAAAEDADAIAALVGEAFDTSAERDLVLDLRSCGSAVLEIACFVSSVLAGYVMCSRLLSKPNGLQVWSIAPLAVGKPHRGTGIGGLLVQLAIEECRAVGADGICVLGDPEYYGRFGFSSAVGERVDSAYRGVGAPWMALEFQADALDGAHVTYPEPFGALDE